MHLPMTLLGLAALSVALSPMTLASPAGFGSRSSSPNRYKSRPSSSSDARTSVPNPCLEIEKTSGPSQLGPRQLNPRQLNPCIAEMIRVELKSRELSQLPEFEKSKMTTAEAIKFPKFEKHQRTVENAIKNMSDGKKDSEGADTQFKGTLFLRAGNAIKQYVDGLAKAKRSRKWEIVKTTAKEIADDNDRIVMLSIFTSVILRLPEYYEINGKDRRHKYEYMVMSIGALALELSSQTRTHPDWDERVRDILQGVHVALDQKITVEKMGQVNLKAYVPVNEQLIKKTREKVMSNMDSVAVLRYKWNYKRYLDIVREMEGWNNVAAIQKGLYSKMMDLYGQNPEYSLPETFFFEDEAKM